MQRAAPLFFAQNRTLTWIAFYNLDHVEVDERRTKVRETG